MPSSLRALAALALIAVFSLAPALPASAALRALVIGVDDYENVVSLERAVNDAAAMAKALEGVGYDVVYAENPTRRALSRTIAAFTASVEADDVVVFFYAGHGVEIDGRNFLLPADIPGFEAPSPDFVEAEAIELASLLERFRETGARLSVSIVDACRDNPFKGPNGRSVIGGRGLARVAPPEGSFVLFSAGAGQIALDKLSDADEDTNSVFTRSLLPLIEQPGLGLRDLAVQLRRDVAALAGTRNHRQVPAYYDEMLGEYAFVPGEAAPPAPVPAGLTPPSAAEAQLKADYSFARTLGTAQSWQVFLDRHGESAAEEVAEARRALARLATVGETASVPATLTADERRAVQRRLSVLGYDTGGIDAIFGPKTRAAITAWQRAARRPVGVLSRTDADLLLGRRPTARPAPTTRPAAAAGPQSDLRGFSQPGGRYIDEAGCAREADGRVILCP